jgi:hypothetical protein
MKQHLATFLNDTESILEKISAIASLGSYLGDAPAEERARLGIILLEIVGDYASQLTIACDSMALICREGHT